MAKSPSHKFGQTIGNLLEELTKPPLERFCKERNLFLDKQGPRPGVRSGKKVSWQDKYGNSHDLDFVIEQGGQSSNCGKPVAFIEAAWRRYTKHSRNKVQEIQGAVLPIAEKYAWHNPFIGVVLAGVFTDGSINQLKSLGFNVVYIAYEDIITAFRENGINVEFDETTSDEVFARTVALIEKLKKEQWNTIINRIYRLNEKEFDTFFSNLEKKLDRLPERIIIIPLHGNKEIFENIESAIAFLNSFNEEEKSGEFRKYEVIIKYSNGDQIDAEFSNKERVQEFLEYATS